MIILPLLLPRPDLLVLLWVSSIILSRVLSLLLLMLLRMLLSRLLAHKVAPSDKLLRLTFDTLMLLIWISRLLLRCVPLIFVESLTHGSLLLLFLLLLDLLHMLEVSFLHHHASASI